MVHRTAGILAIGDELMLGQKLDTNSRLIAQSLFEQGVMPLEHVTVPDDLDAIAESVERLCGVVDFLAVTGGLGPTDDDLTRAALADVLGDELVEDPKAVERIAAYFEAIGREMPERNRIQALRPRSAECLDNPVGTAPGLFVHIGDGRPPGRGGCDVVCLPGPPRELKPMLARVLADRVVPSGTSTTRVLQTVGLGESDVAHRLGQLMDRRRNPLVGTTASSLIVSVRIRSIDVGGHDATKAALDQTESDVRARLGASVFASGDGPDVLERTVVELLRERGETLGVVESCTGGWLGEAITSVPGSSDVFPGGLVTYSNRLKTQLAGVPPELIETHGAVSAQVARAMGVGGRAVLGVDHCLAISGVAGPGASEAKPAGTVWIALASGEAPEDVRLFRHAGDRAMVRMRSVRTALAMLRLRLAGVQMPLLGEVEAPPGDAQGSSSNARA